MKLIPVLPNEKERIEALKSYGILDTPPEAEYDALTSLASKICGTPISLITLVDDTRQWFKSAHGTEVRETPREHAFCTHAILNPQETLVIPDLRKDERFWDNPLVSGDPHVVFYAGVPLTDNNGFAIGSLCVLDVKEHRLNEFQLNALRTLAGQVVTIMQLQRRNKNIQTFQKLLEERITELEEAVRLTITTAPAVNQLTQTLAALQQNHAATLSAEGKELAEKAEKTAFRISGVLEQVRGMG
ncbi:MAG TPA: GAF domain-containing protein [Flavisolibacter sp.]|jgi:GAF domain-containing protein|nr:GAF domain-containing protein [Flavisolibacter sp.]